VQLKQHSDQHAHHHPPQLYRNWAPSRFPLLFEGVVVPHQVAFHLHRYNKAADPGPINVELRNKCASRGDGACFVSAYALATHYAPAAAIFAPTEPREPGYPPAIIVP
jgi:hypothetical protein